VHFNLLICFFKIIKLFANSMARHLTTGNCSPPIRAVRATQNRSRAYALGAVLSPPHLGRGTFATQSPLPVPNVSYLER